MTHENRIAALQSVLRNEKTMRQQYSQELLDDIGSLLSVINYNLNVIEQDNLVDNLIMGKVYNLVNAAIEETRKLSHEIMPHTLMHLGLDLALRELFYDTQAKTGISIHSYLHNLDSDAQSHEAVLIYRLFETILRFFSKNKGIEEVTIECDRSTDHLLFYVYTDGIVSYYPDFEKDLNLIQCYTSILNGEVHYEWYTDGEAKIIITFPTDIV